MVRSYSGTHLHVSKLLFKAKRPNSVGAEILVQDADVGVWEECSAASVLIKSYAYLDQQQLKSLSYRKYSIYLCIRLAGDL